jgi:hypothetical protein
MSQLWWSDFLYTAANNLHTFSSTVSIWLKSNYHKPSHIYMSEQFADPRRLEFVRNSVINSKKNVLSYLNKWAHNIFTSWLQFLDPLRRLNETVTSVLLIYLHWRKGLNISCYLNKFQWFFRHRLTKTFDTVRVIGMERLNSTWLSWLPVSALR